MTPDDERSARDAGAAFARAFVREHGRRPTEREIAIAWAESYVAALEEALVASLSAPRAGEDARRAVAREEAVDSLRERLKKHGGASHDPACAAYLAGAAAALAELGL